MTGTVATDPTGINTITITQFPTGAQSVTINGVTYTAQTFPPAGVTVTLVQLANLSVVPLITATEVVIPYVARDDAGLPSSTGTVKIPLVQSPDLRLTMTTPTTPLTVGNNATYTLQVTNVGPFPTSSTTPLMTVVDTLPPNVQYVSATGLNWNCSAAGSVSTGQVVTCTSTQPLPANTGTASPITLVVKPLDAVVNTTVLNKASVQGGGETQTNYDLATPANSGTPNANNNSQLSTFVQQAASLSGVVWRDTDHNRKYDSNESPIAGFIVEVVDANDNVIATTTTDASGSYRFTGLPPNQPLKVRFRNPGTNNVVSGTPTNNDQTADTRVNSVRSDVAGTSTIAPSELVVNLTPGNNLGNQSLPLDPAGVVYDSLTRLPVGNATVTLLRNNSPVPATDIVGGLSTMTTCGPAVSATCPLPGGYQFLLNPTAPAGTYKILVSASGYVSPSVIIPVTAPSFNPATGAGQVESINKDNVLGNPPPQVGQDTTYYLNFVLNPSSSKGVVNNHIPLDPQTRYSLFTSKAADRTVVELGDSVKYTVTVERLDTVASVQTRVFVSDLLPAGFNYMPGTLTVNGQPVTDASVGLVGRGPVLNMNIANANLQPNRGNVLTLTYRVRVGVGSLEGTGINQVQANLPGLISNPAGLPNCSGQPQLCSNIAQAKVKVTAGVFTTEACVVGKVYVDCNNNQVQDNEELGIPGVRMYMEDGRGIVTDVEGKYSFCGLSPKTHVLKLDATTMPVRSRVIVSSNRNAGDPGSLFVDAKKGELVRADFIEGSCSHPVIEQVKARRSQGEVRTVESETSGISLKWNAKPPADPQQATDSANQPLVQPRAPLGSALGNRQ
jgi:uncharacterized repeat protein (TIGR01451 family)